MDIHAPHEPVHTWRDFLTHLAIVTIGLFIALMLEALVEHIHHVHIVREARANIRIEIEANHEAAQKDLALLQQNIDLERSNIKAIRSLAAHPKDFKGSIQNSMNFDSMEDAAWRTARDTGALAYMPYDEVQRYSDLYMLEDLVNTHAISTGESDFRAAVPFAMGLDADQLSPADYAQMIRDNAAVIVQLTTLKQFVQQLDDACVAELKR